MGCRRRRASANAQQIGYFGLSCRGNRAELVILFSDHPLAEVDLESVPFTGDGAFVFADKKGTRVIEGPRLLPLAMVGPRRG